MEECELCGRSTKDVYVLNVEGVELRACASCAKGKKVVRTELEAGTKKKSVAASTRPLKDEEKPLIENYGAVIRRARESMKIPIKVLAEMLNEKEHYLVRVEEQETEPNIVLTRKLEKELKIKLTEESLGETVAYKPKKSDTATLGEFAD